MDINLIIYIIVLIVLIILVFKFIKKVIVAVITSFVVIVLSFVCVGTLIYLDYSELSNLDDATIELAYIKDGSFHAGIVLPVSKEDGIDREGVAALSEEEYSSTNKGENTFTISIDENVFDILKDEKVELNEFLDSYGFADYIEQDISINTNDLKGVLDSSDPNDEFIKLVLKELNLDDFLSQIVQDGFDRVVGDLESSGQLDVHSLSLVLLLMQLTDEEYIVELIISYQEDDIEVSPSKLSFQILKYMPISLFKDQINSISESIDFLG